LFHQHLHLKGVEGQVRRRFVGFDEIHIMRRFVGFDEIHVKRRFARFDEIQVN
jgi:hypothetical protein